MKNKNKSKKVEEKVQAVAENTKTTSRSGKKAVKKLKREKDPVAEDNIVLEEDVVEEELLQECVEIPVKRKRGRPKVKTESVEEVDSAVSFALTDLSTTPDTNYSMGLHMMSTQIEALSKLVACLDCGEEINLGLRSTTKGMITELTVNCKTCDSQKMTNTPNMIRERRRKYERKNIALQKTENINYAHVAAFLDNGLGYSGLRHYCRYCNARCLNEATFIVYAKQVIADVVSDTEDFLQQNARIVRRAFESQIESDIILDLTVAYTTTYHQWGSDFCLVAGAVLELQTGLVLDYDVSNMYCHVCKINAKKIVSMNPAEMTEWFTKHQSHCEIREWCDEIDQDNEEGVKEIDPKYLEAFIAKKIWNRSLEKFGFRYSTLIHESDEKIHAELVKSAPYGEVPVVIDEITNCFSRRKSEHARMAFHNKLKSKCPRERVQTKDRVMYVYAMAIPEYNKFAIGSNIRLRELVRRMEIEERDSLESGTAEMFIYGSRAGQEPDDTITDAEAFEVEAANSSVIHSQVRELPETSGENSQQFSNGLQEIADAFEDMEEESEIYVDPNGEG